MAENYMDKLAPKLDHVDTLADIFKLFKRSIYKNLHVASLAIYRNISIGYSSNTGYGVAEVAPIPVEKDRGEYTISAYFLDDYGFEENELVAVIYTDLNFLDNLNTNRRSQLESSDVSVHSQMNAIIIPATKNGPQGKSAYQVAVDNGFSGTEQEWLDSLVGPQGPEGPEGPEGPSATFYRHFIKLEGTINDLTATIFLEILSKTNSDFTGDTFGDLDEDYTVYRINGYYNNKTYELLKYNQPSFIYESTKDLGTTTGRVQIYFEDFVVVRDDVNEIK